jgi:hypothetical protein
MCPLMIKTMFDSRAGEEVKGGFAPSFIGPGIILRSDKMAFCYA